MRSSFRDSWPCLSSTSSVALVAAGLSRYGFQPLAARLLDAALAAAGYLDLRRLPELLCGFDRRAGEGPTLYPVACAPQAWSAAAIYLMLGACLGMVLDAPRRKVTFRYSTLPETIGNLRIRQISFAGGSLDLLLERHRRGVPGTALLDHGGRGEVADV